MHQVLQILGVLKITGKRLITYNIKTCLKKGLGNGDVQVILHHDRDKIDPVFPSCLLLCHLLVGSVDPIRGKEKILSAQS